MTNPIAYRCDVCHEPATQCTRDVLRIEDPGAQFARFEPIGKLRFGCELHPVESVEHVTMLPTGRFINETKPADHLFVETDHQREALEGMRFVSNTTIKGSWHFTGLSVGSTVKGNLGDGVEHEFEVTALTDDGVTLRLKKVSE